MLDKIVLAWRVLAAAGVEIWEIFFPPAPVDDTRLADDVDAVLLNISPRDTPFMRLADKSE